MINLQFAGRIVASEDVTDEMLRSDVVAFVYPDDELVFCKARSLARVLHGVVYGPAYHGIIGAVLTHKNENGTDLEQVYVDVTPGVLSACIFV